MTKRVAVLGGGISGLVAAWNLARKRCCDVLLLEASGGLGGWMRSKRGAGGAVFELGPRSIRTAGPSGKATLAVLSDLGLHSEILPITSAHKGASRRLIYSSQHGLCELPGNASWLYRTRPPFTRPLLGALLRDVFTRKQPGSVEDETVKDFFLRKTTPEVLDYMIDPLCRGVYASSPEVLSMRSCFPPFYQGERRHGSVVLGQLRSKQAPLPDPVPELVQQASAERWVIYSLRGGLQTLPEGLASGLAKSGARVWLEAPCTGVSFSGGKTQVAAGGEVHEVDHVISTLPSNVLSTLVPSDHTPLARSLAGVSSVSVGVVCLEFEGSDVIPSQYRESFGYLVPSKEPGSKVMGVVFDSSVFPELDQKATPTTRMTVMLGGQWFEELFGEPAHADESAITSAALEDLHHHLGISQPPSHIITRIHRNCIPQYRLGHSALVDSISGYISAHSLPLSLLGSFYRGVSVNDCVHNALQSTDCLAHSLAN